MNIGSCLRIIGGVAVVVGSTIVGKLIVGTGQKVQKSTKKYQEVDKILNAQEEELEQKRKIRDDLLKNMEG